MAGWGKRRRGERGGREGSLAATVSAEETAEAKTWRQSWDGPHCERVFLTHKRGTISNKYVTPLLSCNCSFLFRSRKCDVFYFILLILFEKVRLIISDSVKNVKAEVKKNERNEMMGESKSSPSVIWIIPEWRRCRMCDVFNCLLLCDLMPNSPPGVLWKWNAGDKPVNKKINWHRGLLWVTFKFCFTDQNYLDSLDSFKCAWRTIICEVPQGSFLGPLPLIFLLANSDYKYYSIFLHVYAEDTEVYVFEYALDRRSAQSLSTCQLVDASDFVSYWCKKNKSLGFIFSKNWTIKICTQLDSIRPQFCFHMRWAFLNNSKKQTKKKQLKRNKTDTTYVILQFVMLWLQIIFYLPRSYYQPH